MKWLILVCALVAMSPPAPVTAQPTTRFLAATVCGTWHSDWGDVTFQCGQIDTSGLVPITGFWSQAINKRGVIKSGNFNPSSGMVRFDYYEPWANLNGSAVLSLDPSGAKLSGTWAQSGGNGTWALWR